MNKIQNNSIYLKPKSFFNIINVFTVPFDQLNASLLNENIIYVGKKTLPPALISHYAYSGIGQRFASRHSAKLLHHKLTFNAAGFVLWKLADQSLTACHHVTYTGCFFKTEWRHPVQVKTNDNNKILYCTLYSCSVRSKSTKHCNINPFKHSVLKGQFTQKLKSWVSFVC